MNFFKFKKKNILNNKQQMFFAQRLSLLLNSGISISESLIMIKNIEKNIKMRKIYEKMIILVQSGMSLSKSIKIIDIKLNSLLYSFILNGEENGNLSEALYESYVYLQKKDDIKNKITSSAIYPLFIILATIIMTLFLILYIFPKIIPLFNSLNMELPLITRIVQELYYLLLSYGLWFVILFITIFFVFKLCLHRFIRFKIIIHRFLLKLPIVGNIVKTIFLSSVCNMSEMFIKSGKSLTETILFISNYSNNIVYKKTFNQIYIESIRGLSFTESLNNYSDLFPSLMIDMSLIGEKTGKLGDMLGNAGKILEQDIDNFLKRFTSLIEPILMVFMGLIVGSIALSIILPVYEITNHLSK